MRYIAFATRVRYVQYEIEIDGAVVRSVVPRVLLVTWVEDERELYTIALRAAGLHVQCAKDGDQVIAAALAHRVDAVVSRIVQPTLPMDGFTMTRRVKAVDATIGVVLLTTLMDPEVRLKALGAGCDAVLLLPATPEDVVARVMDLVERRERGPRPRMARAHYIRRRHTRRTH